MLIKFYKFKTYKVINKDKNHYINFNQYNKLSQNRFNNNFNKTKMYKNQKKNFKNNNLDKKFNKKLTK